jgi:hypothetical protein
VREDDVDVNTTTHCQSRYPSLSRSFCHTSTELENAHATSRSHKRVIVTSTILETHVATSSSHVSVIVIDRLDILSSWRDSSRYLSGEHGRFEDSPPPIPPKLLHSRINNVLQLTSKNIRVPTIIDNIYYIVVHCNSMCS